MIFHSPPIVLGSFRAGSSAVVRYQCGHLVSVFSHESPRFLAADGLYLATVTRLRSSSLSVCLIV
jgi:hypothetical protein